MAIEAWIDKENVVYTCIYSGILCSHKKKEILSFAAAKMNLECNEWNKPNSENSLLMSHFFVSTL